MTALATGLVLGIAGSLHCAGMCGPLVLAVGRGLAAPSRRAQAGRSLLYHAGRVFAYVAVAVPAGMAGQALAVRGLGRVVAVAAALLLVAGAAGSFRRGPAGRLAARCSARAARLSVSVLQWGRRHPVAGPVLGGAANGLIPCGLVYAAVTLAVAAGSTADGVLLMLGFGLGTTPLLAALSLSAVSLPRGVRQRLARLTPAVLAIAAALLLARAIAPAPHADHSPPSAVSAGHE